MSYLFVYFKKVTNFAARSRRAKGRKKLTVSDEYNGK